MCDAVQAYVEHVEDVRKSGKPGVPVGLHEETIRIPSVFRDENVMFVPVVRELVVRPLGRSLRILLPSYPQKPLRLPYNGIVWQGCSLRVNGQT